MNTKNIPIAILCLVLIILCACVLTGAGLFSVLSLRRENTTGSDVSPIPTFTSSRLNPSSTFTIPPPTITAIPSLQAQPTSSPLPDLTIQESTTPTDTLSIFENTIVQMNDPIQLAMRLQGVTELPTQLESPIRQYQLQDQEMFWVLDTDTNQNSQVQATLKYITEHAYFWVEDHIRYNPDHLESLMETFEGQIYPTNRAFFGSEWSPGVDADPRIFILYARNLGRTPSGYFSPIDEYLPAVHEYSNAHEMIFLNANRLGLGESFAYSAMAHEYQHMIHWNLDRNEDTWMNEGFANLAAFINGYDVGGTDFAYVQNPDLQLNYWSSIPNKRLPHYGASFLFLAYFLDRFGEQTTQALVANPANGISSIDQILDDLQITDPQEKTPIRADDVFADWVVATFLQDEKAADGRFVYHNYPDAPKPDPTEIIETCPQASSARDVSQFGVDYIRINCQGAFSLRFEGSTSVDVLPVSAYSASHAFYSNHGDESTMSLTQKFDFTEHFSPLTFSFWTWYDLEKDYDFVYLTASLDGEHWQILTTPSGTAEDPTGNNYGWGYNGLSGRNAGLQNRAEWIQESVDISQFSGEQVWLRFEYITDSAVYNEGFLVDDISIPEIGYFTNFEDDGGGWQADGFVRIQNSLPQKYQLSLILIGDTIRVEKIVLDAGNRADIPLSIGEDVDYAVLVVSGTTRFTRQKAVYQFSILPD